MRSLEIIGQATALAMIQEYPVFLEAVSAGFPSPCDDHLEGTLDLNQYLVRHPSATFFVRASGNSMINAGIRHGDLLLVDRSIEPSNGDIIIAVVDGELTVKRLCKEQGKVFLAAENPHYSPIEIKGDMELKVWGTILYVIHATRKQA